MIYNNCPSRSNLYRTNLSVRWTVHRGPPFKILSTCLPQNDYLGSASESVHESYGWSQNFLLRCSHGCVDGEPSADGRLRPWGPITGLCCFSFFLNLSFSERQPADSSIRVEHSKAGQRCTFRNVQASPAQRPLYGGEQIRLVFFKNYSTDDEQSY